MQSGFSRPVRTASVLLLVACVAARAQNLPPIEPAKPLPAPQAENQTLEVTTTEVLVPTLVKTRGGEIVYGLKADDFIVEDDGVAQKIRVQEEMDTAPVALVVAVELGGAGVLEFDKLAHLGPLLDLFLSDKRSRVALVGFDSTQHLIDDFTQPGEAIGADLKRLDAGDGGVAILDAVSYGVSLLESQPKEYRRVLLLVSEERDRGSKHARPAALVRQIGASDVLVLSVSFSPARAELAHDVKDSGEDRTLNMVSTLAMAVRAFKKNVAREVAEMSGGEYTTFTSDKRFEERVVDAARQARNRYLITFSPSDPTPGLHTIRVRLAQDYGVQVMARANYWMESGQ
jgi:VWFA-related protein